MEHPTVDELAFYVFDPEKKDLQGIAAHVEICAKCAAEVTDLRQIEAALADPETWAIADHNDGTAQSLREIREQALAEDAAAEMLLSALVASPARAAWANLAERRKYHTAGVVRRLVTEAHAACEREPLDALTLADAAIEVVGRLNGYPRVTLRELCGNAWKERANALTALGRYDDALDHAEREFREVATAPLGPVMVRHAKGIVHYERGELPRARELLTACASEYERLGEPEHYMRARHYLANILYREGNIRAAQSMYQELLAWGESENNRAWLGHTHRTLGHCAYQLRDFAAASVHFHQSAAAFRELGSAAEVNRTEWGFGLVLLSTGNFSEALSVLGQVRTSFEAHGMLTDAALVGLSMMEAHHALSDSSAIVALANDIARTFTAAGMLTSALTAFAYLREAARSGMITREKLTHVRDFVRRLEREPALLFLPPE